jgi:hypothetical protein
LYRGVDTCVLDEMVASLERAGVRDSMALRSLSPLLRDSSRVVKSTYSLDVTERVLPGVQYSRQCVRRIDEDRAGFTLLAPLLVADWENNVYARDLHARNEMLLRQYPGRAVYLMRPSSGEIGAPPQFFPVSRDSLERAWRDEH